MARKKKPEFNFQITESCDENPWQYRNLTDFEYSNFYKILDHCEKNGVTAVAVWNADGSKQLKYRYAR